MRLCGVCLSLSGLFSFSIMSSGSMPYYIVANSRISSCFFTDELYFPACMYVCVYIHTHTHIYVCRYICHIFLIHLVTDRHLDCFHKFLVTNTAVNMGVQITLIYFFIVKLFSSFFFWLWLNSIRSLFIYSILTWQIGSCYHS